MRSLFTWCTTGMPGVVSQTGTAIPVETEGGDMSDISGRLAAIERKASNESRPVVVLFGNDAAPVPTAGEPTPLILRFDDEDRDL